MAVPFALLAIFAAVLARVAVAQPRGSHRLIAAAGSGRRWLTAMRRLMALLAVVLLVLVALVAGVQAAQRLTRQPHRAIQRR